MNETYIYDYNKLRGKIIEEYGSLKNFARVIGSSQSTVCMKLTNKVFFTQKDIDKYVGALHIPSFEIPDYFFVHAVQ